jgi:hypothetical protein
VRIAYSGIGATALAFVAMLALAAPAGAKQPVFGIVPQDGALPTAADLDMMPAGGVGAMRSMISWAYVERNRGTYDWGATDQIIRETTNRGIQPFVFLYGTPDWAAKIDGRDCSTDCAVYPPKTPETREAFGAFAAAAAARYGPGGDFWEAPVLREDDPYGENPVVDPCSPDPELCIPEPPPNPPAPVPTPPLPTEPPCACTEASPITVWQMWNEQNSPKYFAPKVNVARYAALLKAGAAGIRSVDPAAEIVLGGMWGPNSAREVVTTTRKYLQKLFSLGAAADFDSVAIHPYANNADLSVAQLESARRLLDRHGDRKAGMWITEVGWAARGPSDNPYVKGLDGQARVLSRALSQYKRRARSLRLRGVFWYSWRDLKGGDSICDWCGHAGLRTKRGEAKPAWDAFVKVARG